MAALIDARDTERTSERYARNFVEWSQSSFGFYVRRHFNKHWITERGPIRWQPHQIRAFNILFDFDLHGRLPFSDILWIDTGQTGKSLTNAAVCQWIGMFHEVEADIQIISNSKEQSKQRVYSALKSSLRMHPASNRIAEIQEQAIYFRKTGNRAAAIPANAATQAGGSPALRSIDEWWDWVDEAAKTLMAEIKETPARDISLLFASSYPGFADDQGPLNAQLADMFDLNDEPLSDVEMPDEDIPLYVKGKTAVWWNHDPLIYPWISQSFLDRQMNDPKVTEAHFARIWMARRPEREDAFMPIKAWDACEDEAWSPLGPEDRGVLMVIAIDAGTKSDSTALVARNYNPTTGLFELLDHRIWSDEEYNGAGGAMQEVKKYVLDLHRRHKVLEVYYDPNPFAAAASDLEDAGVPMIEMTQNNSRTAADTNYRSLIVTRSLRNYPQSFDLREHVLHAVGVENGAGQIRLDKRKAALKIDGAVADSMACWGALEHKADFVRFQKQRGPVTPYTRPPSPFKQTFFPNRVRHG